MSYPVRVALKAAIWIGSFWPLGALLRGFLTDDLGALLVEDLELVGELDQLRLLADDEGVAGE